MVSGDEQDELRRLREENARLKAQQSGRPAHLPEKDIRVVWTPAAV